jgi:hypothetical protein
MILSVHSSERLSKAMNNRNILACFQPNFEPLTPQNATSSRSLYTVLCLTPVAGREGP